MDLVGYLNNAIIECRILPGPDRLPANDIGGVSIVCLREILNERLSNRIVGKLLKENRG